MDLPENIIIDILLHLPIRGIVMCKCTCKTWFCLISSRHFAKLHFGHVKECILLGNWDLAHVSRILYLIEPSEINTKYCCCDGIKSGYQVNMKRDTRLKVPLCNDEMMLISSGNHNAEAMALCKGNTKRKRTIKLDHPYAHRCDIVNSCNGFLCLNDRNREWLPIIVCNPITNEYIRLPEGNISKRYMHVYSGFGFCNETNQYKVLRVFYEGNAEIHTLGTESWKSIGFAPTISDYINLPTYWNGVLYWVGKSNAQAQLVLSFEFRSECFRTLPEPRVERHSRTSIGIIGDCVCLSAHSGDVIVIWVLNKCGFQTSWSKLVSMTLTVALYGDMENFLNFRLINCLKCKEFFIVYSLGRKVVYYDPKREAWKKLKLHGLKIRPELFMHTPSFISLKDVVAGAITKSMSTGFKLHGETRSLYLREDA